LVRWTRQHIALPLYVDPLIEPDVWSRVGASPHGTVALVVANVANGPGLEPDDRWTDVASSVTDRGIPVLGYVDNGYLGMTRRKSRAGGTSARAWMRQIVQDAENWHVFLGRHFGGVFLDSVPNSLDPTEVASWTKMYSQFTTRFRHDHPNALVVLNTGNAAPRSYGDLADSIVTYEGRYADYLAEPGSSPYAFSPLAWSARDVCQIWHIVYAVPSVPALKKVLQKSYVRECSNVFVTDSALPNPYSGLPSYWDEEIAAVASRSIRKLPSLQVSAPQQVSIEE
jgi:hypothetical protein